MFKSWLVVIVVVLGIISVVCVDRRIDAQTFRAEEWMKKVLGGEHELRKMDEFASSQSNLRGSFFLGTGTINGKGESVRMVTFSWQWPETDEWVITSLPIEKVRLSLSDSAPSTPTISFCWRIYRSYWGSEPQELMDGCVLYASIACKPDAWKEDVTLPLNE